MKSEQSHYSRAEQWRESGSDQKHLPRAISEQKEAKAVRLSTPECSRAAISLHHYHNKLITEIRGGRGRGGVEDRSALRPYTQGAFVGTQHNLQPH